jgi:hypothetical protein
MLKANGVTKLIRKRDNKYPIAAAGDEAGGLGLIWILAGEPFQGMAIPAQSVRANIFEVLLFTKKRSEPHKRVAS